MPNFSYVAVERSGRQRKGTVESINQEQAVVKLKSEGLLVMDIKPEDIWNKEITFSRSGGVKPRDLSVFCRQFVSMITAGVTIIDALGMLSEQTENKAMAKAIRNVQTDIEKGDAMSEAMAKRREIFTDMLVNMVAAGESSGDLETAFERMAEHFEKSARLKAMIKKAAIYPVAVFIVAIVVVIVMLVKVIPAYEEMFDELGSDLPAITKLVVTLSNGLRDYWYIILILVTTTVVSLMLFKRTDNGQRVFGTIGYRMPIFGKLTIKTASSLFARTMSTMLYAGIPMIQAIDNVSKVMTNALFRDALTQAKDEVAKGVPLSEPIGQCGLFPPMVHHMTKIGEETGDIESMLERLANYYDEEVEMATQAVMAALEPMIIVLLAVIVGTIVAAVMAPMFQMYNDMNSLV